MEPVIIIPYLKKEYFDLTVKSIKDLGITWEIIGIPDIPADNVEHKVNNPNAPVKYNNWLYMWEKLLLPKVKDKNWFYTEEGVIWTKVPEIKETSYWFSWTKFVNKHPVGLKLMYFIKEDYENIVELWKNRKSVYVEKQFYNSPWLNLAPRKIRGRTTIPEIEYFKLIKKESNFGTTHPKFHYIDYP